MKKNVRSLTSGPPSPAELLIAGQRLVAERVASRQGSLRSRYDAELWNSLVPDLVDMLMTPPVVRPNSAAKMLRVI